MISRNEIVTRFDPVETHGLALVPSEPQEGIFRFEPRRSSPRYHVAVVLAVVRPGGGGRDVFRIAAEPVVDSHGRDHLPPARPCIEVQASPSFETMGVAMQRIQTRIAPVRHHADPVAFDRTPHPANMPRNSCARAAVNPTTRM